MKLASYSQGRDNNFNLIRIIAALSVIVAHSFAVAGSTDIFQNTVGLIIAKIAVDIFFITSGHLVTASLLERKSTIEFVLARALRIFPALWVMLFLTVFLLGPFFTSHPLSSYFLDPRPYIYLKFCATLFFGIAYKLPGVFDSNPYKSIVNGSLWSMYYEIYMYAILAIGWFALRITPKYRLKAFQMFIVTFAALSGAYIFDHYINSLSTDIFIWLSFMFFSGASFYILKEHIPLSRPFFYSIVIVLLYAFVNARIFIVVYILSIAYSLLYLAYVPSGRIRKYNILGDYSYGIYIYAFPVQQSVAALIPGVSVVRLTLISAGITILLAVASWHLLERRALGLKSRYINTTR